MKMILAVMVLGLAACGGTDNRAAPYEGEWAIQYGTASGTLTLARGPTSAATGVAAPTQEVHGTWSLGALGSGEVVGNIMFDSTVELLFVRADNTLVGDASVAVSGATMVGTARQSGSPDAALTGYRL